MQEAKTYQELLDVLLADSKKTVGIYQRRAKQRQAALSKLKQLEARRLRFEKYQTDMKIPAALRKQIAELEAELLRAEHAPPLAFGDGFGNGEARWKKKALSALFEEADQIKNPPKSLSTTNKAFKIGKAYPGQSFSRAYDGHVWEVLRGHFQPLPRTKGQRTSFKVVAALPEKNEYLQLKERHFTKTLEALLDEAYEVVDELHDELQDAYANMPKGLQGGTVGEARMEAASQLETISGAAPTLPDSVSAISLVHFPALRQSSRSDRADEAAAKLKAASQEIQKYINSGIKLKKAEVAELEECRQQLESRADEIEAVEIPGMFG
jgi:hypothetical protein